jgi:alpha-acetolactate decarboxylase
MSANQNDIVVTTVAGAGDFKIGAFNALDGIRLFMDGIALLLPCNYSHPYKNPPPL